MIRVQQQQVTSRSRGVRFRRTLWHAVAFVLLVLLSAIISIPLFWVISNALKAPTEVYLYPPRWIPRPPQWGNFAKAWSMLPFWRFLRNSLLTTVVPTVATVFVSALVGYSFARMRWHGRDAVLMLCMATMMLPSQVTLIPRFLIFKQLKWIDTFYPLIVPSLFGSAYDIFLARQFLLTLPAELEEAATIDGCSTFRTWWQVIMPLCKPVLTVIAIFAFMGHWSEFFGPLIYLNSRKNWTIMLGVVSFQDRLEGEVSIHLMMALSFLTMLPCLLLFFSSQKVFIEGIALTGVKG